jgi:hypothetical protein
VAKGSDNRGPDCDSERLSFDTDGEDDGHEHVVDGAVFIGGPAVVPFPDFTDLLGRPGVNWLILLFEQWFVRELITLVPPLQKPFAIERAWFIFVGLGVCYCGAKRVCKRLKFDRGFQAEYVRPEVVEIKSGDTFVRGIKDEMDGGILVYVNGLALATP